ncbi:MAG: winged helix DNA-binding domain-containing protein [Thermoplasmata archaeon]|nr:winged helix DNA-binding domain-containing protein [Thermoplasmata archaeon]
MTAKPRGSTSTGPTISWSQVAAFRLRQHHLIERAPAGALLSVLDDMNGAQAQVLSAAFISLWARIRGLTPARLERALWRDRTLAKAWCMRRTVHLLPSAQLAVFVRGTTRRAEKELQYMRRHVVSGPALDELVDAVLDAMDEPRTRSEIAVRVGRSLGLRVLAERGGGWGSARAVACVKVRGVSCSVVYLLHVVAARGVVCSGPPRGNESTFVRAEAWLPKWRDVPVPAAERELLRRYLHAFGPATPADFAWWTGMTLSGARSIWALEEDALARVNVDGREAWILRRDLPELEMAVIDRPSVRLLPFFDSFVLGQKDRGHLVDAPQYGHVYRGQGWVAPVVLSDGRVTGVWSHTARGPRLDLRVRSFAPMKRALATRVRAEGRDLARFLGCTQVDTTL